ncbi:LOW QUALITY PROTEIN: cell growth-regulating nucleolar protein [Amblyraja radiata]|uniref:LOW QUALITY PROTEIN: cell growth-regulating nucleolar protein n=1 Tax=Amblyraja radiata TaxID=386614 RepID=UPI001402D553|nr:LOW QUALITY PROTEIN: cell growth-regulating nucleolar protein [Amblyraja radiata]
MVFFTCNGCGESVKKAQVEKHFNICRSCSCLSCIDCGKDFRGNDYKLHTKCITEDQKYGGKGFEGKAKKGDMKQQQWIQKIHETMNDSKVSPRVREVLQQMDSYDNIPRKKAKFQNWMKNSLRIQNGALQEQVWEIFAAAVSNVSEHVEKSSESVETNSDQALVTENIEKKKNKGNERKKEKTKPKKTKKHLQEDENGLDHKPDYKRREKEEKTKKLNDREEARAVEDNGQDIQQQGSENSQSKVRVWETEACKSSAEGEPKSKEKKVKIAETEDVEENNETKPGKFNWKRTIKMVLQQSPEQEISVKKLRKKVLSQYYAEVGASNFKSEEDLQATFIKKIKCNPTFKVKKDKVRLVS